MADQINFPIGAAHVPTQPGTTGDLAYTIGNALTIIILTGLTGAISGVDLTLNSELPIGARLILKVVQGATGRNVVLGTGFETSDNDTLTGEANDTDILEFIFDGTAFVPIGLWEKIVNAV